MGKYKVLCPEILPESVLRNVHFLRRYIYIFHRQGSFLVYPIDEDDTDETKCQITNGIPINSAIKALARVYIIKVSNSYSVFQSGQIHNGLAKGFKSKKLFQCKYICSRMELL